MKSIDEPDILHEDETSVSRTSIGQWIDCIHLVMFDQGLYDADISIAGHLQAY